MPTQIRFRRTASVAPSSPASTAARFALTAAGVVAAAQIVPGLHGDSLPGLLAAALVLALLNSFLRPVLLLLSLPFVVLSFGLFLWIINAGLLTLASWIVKSFRVDSFPSALGGAAIISLIQIIGGAMLGLNQRPDAAAKRPRTPAQGPRSPGDGPGPVIDV